MAWIKEKIKIRKGYNRQQRKIIGQEIIDFIIERTQSGKDKRNSAFPSYSKSYKDSKEFEIAGKSSKVNLSLSEEMLNSIELLSHSDGEVVVGFNRNDSRNNGVAEGNIKGTYGQASPIPGKKRDFLGITAGDKGEIQDKYPLRNKKKLSAAVADFLLASEAAEDII